MGRHEYDSEYESEPIMVWGWLTPKVRAWLYGVCTALVALLIVYGVVDDEAAAAWVALAFAVLQGGTALAHTPWKVPQSHEGHSGNGGVAEGSRRVVD